MMDDALPKRREGLLHGCMQQAFELHFVTFREAWSGRSGRQPSCLFASLHPTHAEFEKMLRGIVRSAGLTGALAAPFLFDGMNVPSRCDLTRSIVDVSRKGREIRGHLRVTPVHCLTVDEYNLFDLVRALNKIDCIVWHVAMSPVLLDDAPN